MAICFSLYLLFFIYLFLKVEPFTPSGRLSHSSDLVGDKIYFFGGVLDGGGDGYCSREVFFLDVSNSFNISNPPWNNLNEKAQMNFVSCWGTASFDNKKTIYLFNGVTDNSVSIGINSFD